ncbi:glycosyltransferase family A protein [Microbacterium kyungheense]|uniref:glycosyltransferase family A protein n=1 Tax=Microbacterium kyungheense TaxID=1263636 RepID=UPI00163BE397|nr:glycosyltransferase family A protein [Microbacterium kyungheense]
MSVVVPVFNVRRDWVRQAIESLLAVDTPIELIIVDDGSTDEQLVAYLADLPHSDERARYVRQENSGVAAARNLGIDLAKGDWLTFVDPDDRVRPQAEAWGRLSNLSGMDVVLTSGCGFSADGGPVTETYSLAAYEAGATPAGLLEEMFDLYSVGRESPSFVIGVPWSKFVRRAFLLDNELRFDGSIVKRSDAEWMIRLLGRDPRIVIIDDPLVEYRVDIKGSISNRYRPEILDSYLRIMETAGRSGHVSDMALQMYALELIKDAVNNVFSNPDAPASGVSRSAYRAFRRQFVITGGLMTSGRLSRASVGRKLLFVVIWRRWYAPIVGLRWAKKARMRLS